MASSHLLSIAGPLIVPDLNAAQQGASLDQAPLSPARSALSPVRPASPGFHSLPLRAQPLSPSRLMPALALPSQATASLESLSLAAALDQPPALQSTPGEHILGGHPADLISAVSAEGLASAHILITAVALLSSTPDAGATQGGSQLPQNESAQGTSLRETAATDVALAVPEGSDTAVFAEGKHGLKAGPWWLSAEGGNTPNAAAGEGPGPSWWARQVEAARAEDRAQEGRALQDSLHSNKGPDAPYALEGADTLLGAASPSLGEKDNGGAWWSQLTKIPTADWLHLDPQRLSDTNNPATPVGRENVDSEEPRRVEGAEVPAVAQADHKEFSTFSFVNDGAVLTMSEGEVATSPVEHAGEAQPGLDMPQGLTLAVEPRITEAVASAERLESESLGEPEARLSLPVAEGHGTDGAIHATKSSVAQLTEVSPVGGIDPPSLLQVSEVTRKDQSDLAVDSPPSGASDAESQSPVEIHDIDQVSSDPTTLATAATLASAEPSAAPVENETNSALEVAPKSQAQAATVEATPSDSSEVMRKQRAAVEEARARLELIKAWRSRRAATLPLTVSLPPPPLALPVLSGLPSPTLGSGIFPTRGSPMVATLARPDGSIWKTLQQLEWSTEDMADTFGRSSVAVHLAERHDGEHA
ncbi:hypothetical protein KFL_002800080 [Klebsormidium nitens]|uniref:Uncharacterized protein n=1 Tax=Klebsormidium nitens TaxID=105231 RepID=A0A1Y1IDX0_KLENI|nr:hypothetical protein KFL_002800080 [Klebsormidium nitens]|eukprot:GAQ86278.1 hypothetical protein KFL_002800080 [Klebsormidium nitens]